MSDYWSEAAHEALIEIGVSATPAEIEIVAGIMESNHENYGMAHGHDAIPNPLIAEMDRKVAAVEKDAKENITLLQAELDLSKSQTAYWKAQYTDILSNPIRRSDR